MLSLRPVFLVVGILLTTLGLAMIVPGLVDLFLGAEGAYVFFGSAVVTVFIGTSLALASWGYRGDLSIQQAFLLIVLTWVITVTFAALPFAFADLGLSYTDAFFEAMSGLTTTGSTVMTGLDDAPEGILLWRGLLQWLGGIGIIVMAISILPMLQIGGMQLFRIDSDPSDPLLPQATKIAGSITLAYVGASMLCGVCYWFAGMEPFDSVVHAMTTVATGGFSTSDQSIGVYQSSAIETVSIIFMLAGSLPFVLYIQAFKGQFLPFLRDTQVRWFFATVIFLVLMVTFYQYGNGLDSFGAAFRNSAFNVVSIMTGTGYATTDYGLWGGFAVVAFFCIMFIGGCAGSTSCGIKIFRFQVIFQAMLVQIARLTHPHGVFTPTFNRRPIDDAVVASVASFFFVFFLSFAILALSLSMLGLDTLTAFSAAGTAIANVGPGLGEVVGPAGTFAPLPDSAKWLMSAGMLLGRLELFAIIVIFTPTFWRI